MRTAWSNLRESKFFYVNIYRRSIRILIGMLILNLVLCLAIIYSYLHMPKRLFFASDGITAPIELKPWDAPNYSSQALLPPDPVNEDEIKVIPQ